MNEGTERINAAELEIDMFVAELDVPWLTTPFLLQGFLITDEAQITELQQYCHEVYVDRQKSIRKQHYQAPPAPPKRLLTLEPPAKPVEIKELFRATRQPAVIQIEVVGHTRKRRPDNLDYRPIEDTLPSAQASYEQAREALHHVLADAVHNTVPHLGNLETAVETMLETTTHNPDAMLWMTNLKRTDSYSYDHAMDLAVYSSIFGLHLALPREQVQNLSLAGMLADIGKTRIRTELLQKNTPLSVVEDKIFERHVHWSLEFVERIHGIPLDVLKAVGRHHERWDGSGYPAKLAGAAIGLMGEITGIVDTFCAMITERPYARAITPQHALETLIALRGSGFSEQIVDQFSQCIGIYPVGTIVEMNTSEVGIVIEQNRIRRLKPRVLLLLAPDKTPHHYPAPLTLINEPLAYSDVLYSISGTLPRGSYGIDPGDFYL